ncbi:MAG: class I tRNA ligase family protein, partial [Synergistota bacterium]|nr:class I tRNA ligase family protein [Synergistota bacterium]
MLNDYKDTLNLPKSTFPMRAALAKKEPELLKFWSDVDLYQKLMDRAKDSTPFILHDGPPYANGNIHIGTAFNKILKDFIPKYKWMRGYRAHYVPGWDTHGLPIELRVLKDANLTKDSIEPVELRRRCKAYALHYIDVQREEFKRLGVLGDWEHPYITLLPKYEAAELNVLADMIEKGLVYRGLKSVFWCTDCQTALAAAEIEYEDIASPSIYV